MELIAIILIVAVTSVIAWAVYWDYRKKQLEREDRRFLIEKGITPPPVFAAGWPGVKQHEQQLRFEERRLMIEKGMDPPAEPQPKPADYLRRGIILVCLGIGLAIGYSVIDMPDKEAEAFLGLLGPVLGLVGAGYVLYYLLTPKGRKSEEG
jgi:hypothetical protein